MHHFTERNYFPALLPLAPCLYKRHSNQRPRHAADELRARKGGAAGDKWWGLEAGWGGETEFASTDGGMKQAKEGVAGLTILKPDLAFLKAGVRHQLPSFPSFQRHKQSCFLPERWPAHQKEKEKKEKQGKRRKRRKMRTRKYACKRSRGGEVRRSTRDLLLPSPPVSLLKQSPQVSVVMLPAHFSCGKWYGAGQLWQWREEREEEEENERGGKREGRRKNAAVNVSLGKEKEGGHKGETSAMAATWKADR